MKKSILIFIFSLFTTCFSQTRDNSILKKIGIKKIEGKALTTSTSSSPANSIYYINDSGLVEKIITEIVSKDTSNFKNFKIIENYKYDSKNRKIYEETINNDKFYISEYLWKKPNSYTLNYSSIDTNYRCTVRFSEKTKPNKSSYCKYINNKLISKSTYNKIGNNFEFSYKDNYKLINGIEYRDSSNNLIKGEYQTRLLINNFTYTSLEYYEYSSDNLLVRKTEYINNDTTILTYKYLK